MIVKVFSCVKTPFFPSVILSSNPNNMDRNGVFYIFDGIFDIFCLMRVSSISGRVKLKFSANVFDDKWGWIRVLSTSFSYMDFAILEIA